MTRYAIVALAVLALLFGPACSYQRARINYEDDVPQMPIRDSAWEGELLGQVAYNEGGAVWNDCTKSANTSLWVVIDDAKRMGGNAIGNIRWIPNKEKGNTSLPTCKKNWGWFALFPVALSRVFMSSRVQADVYKISDSAALQPGAYRLPETAAEQTELVARIVDDAKLGAALD